MDHLLPSDQPRGPNRKVLNAATALGHLTPELAEECAADLAEAHLKAYDVKAAQAAAREYLDRYPRGARRWKMQLIEVGRIARRRAAPY